MSLCCVLFVITDMCLSTSKVQVNRFKYLYIYIKGWNVSILICIYIYVTQLIDIIQFIYSQNRLSSHCNILLFLATIHSPSHHTKLFILSWA